MNELTPSSESGRAKQNGTDAAAVAVAPVIVQSFGLTDRGSVRDTNQDQFVTATLMRALWVEQSSVPQTTVRYADHRGHVFVVADGMGGEAGGEKASAIAIRAVEDFLLNALRWLLALDGPQDATALRDFKAAVRNADACVYAAAVSDPKLRGMGTTLTMAFSRDADLFLAHVGDSRCYLLRGTTFQRLTRDDTLVQQMVDTGVIEHEGAARHQARHVITNVVGGANPEIPVEVHRLRLEPLDTLLLCTDGLTAMLDDAAIATILSAANGPEDACNTLVRRANEQGGEDNVTVIVVKYT